MVCILWQLQSKRLDIFIGKSLAQMCDIHRINVDTNILILANLYNRVKNTASLQDTYLNPSKVHPYFNDKKIV